MQQRVLDRQLTEQKMVMKQEQAAAALELQRATVIENARAQVKVAEIQAAASENTLKGYNAIASTIVGGIVELAKVLYSPK